MIIRNIAKVYENEWVKNQAEIIAKNGTTNNLFFAVPKECENEVDVSFADNFVVAMILLAAKYNEDICVEDAYVSSELVDNIERYLLPNLEKMGCGNNKTKIYSALGDAGNQVRGNKAVTGISLGVDSFYAILANMQNENNPISSVVYVHGGFQEKITVSKELSYEIEKRRKASQDLGVEFVPILSNINELLNDDFSYVEYHTYYHLAAVMSMKSYACYYYATAYPEDQMHLDFSASGNYDNVIRDAVKHNGFEMVCAGGDVTRFEKTERICHNRVVQANLDVCLPQRKKHAKMINCGKCFKCIRTLTTLDVLGEVEKYSRVFDVEEYLAKRSSFWGNIEYRRIHMKDSFAIEICDKAKDLKCHLPSTRWIYFILTGINNQKHKIIKKKKE